MYDAFDAVICISLRDRVDRREHARRIALQLGMPMQFFIADRHPRGGMVGCLDSHVRVMTRCLSAGYERVLILEDDFLPATGYDDAILRNAIDFVTSDADWEILQLGYGPRGVVDACRFWLAPFAAPSIVEYCGVLTHAYCVSRKGLAHFLPVLGASLDRASGAGSTEPVDFILQRVVRNGYCVVPMLFDQAWCYSSDNVFVHWHERLVLRPLQCTAERTKFFSLMSDMHAHGRVMVAILAGLAVAYAVVAVALVVHWVSRAIHAARPGRRTSV